MAAATLGYAVDVLVGGEDLTFPHHAYQAAMVEAAVSVAPFARRMVHIGAVSQDGAKMAKSTGNLTLVADLLETAPAAAVRLMLLDRRWSEGWEFRPELLAAATDQLHELYAAAARPGATDAAETEVVSALLDDLDVPRARAVATEAGGSAGRLLIRVLALG
jgi:cysteinyl-tRNA synthetase